GETLLDLLADRAAELGLPLADDPLADDPGSGAAVGRIPLVREAEPAGAKVSAAGRNSKQPAAYAAFRQGLAIEEVAVLTGRATSTVEGYLLEYIAAESVTSPEPWLAREVFDLVANTARELQAERMKPIHEALGGDISYGQIRLALAVMANQNAP